MRTAAMKFASINAPGSLAETAILCDRAGQCSAVQFSQKMEAKVDSRGKHDVNRQMSWPEYSFLSVYTLWHDNTYTLPFD